MTVIEVAVYALVLGNAAPALCRQSEPTVVSCSNGLVANVANGEARFNNGIVVDRQDDHAPTFSNGITSRLTRDGWLVFSNGLGVRRMSIGRFDFDNGVSCRAKLPGLIDCALSP